MWYLNILIPECILKRASSNLLQCVLYSVFFTACSLQCVLYSVFFTVCFLQRVLWTIYVMTFSETCFQVIYLFSFLNSFITFFLLWIPPFHPCREEYIEQLFASRHFLSQLGCWLLSLIHHSVLWAPAW